MKSGSMTTDESASEDILKAVAELIRTGSDPDTLAAQHILIRRLALSGETFYSRVPAPRNITEVGGYINLLRENQELEAQSQMICAALGVAGPNPPLGWEEVGPAIEFVITANDRPECEGQKITPISISIRSDMILPFRSAMKKIHEAGCALPLMTPKTFLLKQNELMDEIQDFLPYIGREINIPPGTFLVDPAIDPLAIARNDTVASSGFELVARGTDINTKIPEIDWSAYKCDDNSCEILPSSKRRYLTLAPILASAGWYVRSDFQAPTSINDPGSLGTFINITGLLPGKTRLYDELALLYSPKSIYASIFADKLSWVWNGKTFVEG